MDCQRLVQKRKGKKAMALGNDSGWFLGLAMPSETLRRKVEGWLLSGNKLVEKVRSEKTGDSQEDKLTALD